MSHPTDAPLTVHVVSHTHWDREWYQLAGRFRQRLIPLIDELLDEPDGSHSSFLLDGQTILLEDYLAVRPDRRDLLASRLQSGVLEAGPWYVLADELIPSGEALIRNLLVGRDVLQGLGARAPRVMYSPDAFGHPAALPTIAREFGIAVIVTWRGYGGVRWPPGDSAWWHGPDESKALLYHLTPSGYEQGASLPSDAVAAGDRWRDLRAVLSARASLRLSLLLNGADHHAPQRGRAAARMALARAAAPDRVVASSLGAFASALEAAAGEATLPSVRGELRASYGYTWTLQGTLGARAALKRRCAGVERLLRREAEPWSALATQRGHASRVELTRAAWKTLLQCHPHDTLCGCSTDGVARAMSARLDDAESQAAGLRDDALDDLGGIDPEASRSTPEQWQPVLVLRNSAARERGGVAQVELTSVLRHVPVGPRSAQLVPTVDHPVMPTVPGAVIQTLDGRERHERLESPRAYPWDDLIYSWNALMWIPPLGGYTTRTVPLNREAVAAGGPSPHELARSGERWIENDALRCDVDANGVVHLRTRDGSRTLERLLHLEDMGDGGDLYTFSPRGELLEEPAADEVALVDRGPLRASLELRYRFEVPRDGARPTWYRRRAALPVTLRLSLDASSPFLTVAVTGDNRAINHRLRLVVSSEVLDARIFADAAFGPVERESIDTPEGSAEAAPPTAPLARYVTLANDARGISVLSDGLAEYEATADGEIALTLFRAVGELSREDLPERPGHAGWPVPTPEAQVPGAFEARFAIALHGPRDASCIDRLERMADDFLHPLSGSTTRWAIAPVTECPGVELEGEGLACSAVKRSEDGAWLVLRALNLTSQPVAGAWRLGMPIREARASAMDEREGEPLDVRDGRVAFGAAPRAVVTMLVR